MVNKPRPAALHPANFHQSKCMLPALLLEERSLSLLQTGLLLCSTKLCNLLWNKRGKYAVSGTIYHPIHSACWHGSLKRETAAATVHPSTTAVYLARALIHIKPKFGQGVVMISWESCLPFLMTRYGIWEVERDTWVQFRITISIIYSRHNSNKVTLCTSWNGLSHQ